jgi:hypothetical protein
VREHNTPYPGHPLYQLNFIDSLAVAFNVDKFDILYYNPKVPVACVTICPDSRNKLFANRIDREIYPISRYQPKIDFSRYDAIFLKHRFHNESRLKDLKGLDVEIYERTLREALEAKKPVYIIDSDAELSKDPRFWNGLDTSLITVLSFFTKPEVLPASTLLISPTSYALLDQIHESVSKKSLDYKNFSYDGNNYLKDPSLQGYLKTICKRRYFDNVVVLGKNWTAEHCTSLYPREQRFSFYEVRKYFGYASINITKPIYAKYSFASPRIVESFMLGEYIYAPDDYVYMPDDLKFEDFTEFYHRMIYGVQTWSKDTLLRYAEEYLHNLKMEGFLGL